MGKVLMVTGIVFIVIGAIMHFGIFPLGNLPGDIKVQNGNFTFSFSIITCIILSVVISLILNFLR